MKLIDTHCHLTDGRLDNTDEVIASAQKVGVEKFISPATDLDDSEKVVALSRRYSQVWAAVGIYPGNAEEIGALPQALEKLEQLTQNKKVVAIGEIGLDGYWNKRNLKVQTEVFQAQLLLANKLNLPVVVHSRDAQKEITQVFTKLKVPFKGQFHCFGPDLEFLEFILDRGFYVSFCGNITYKNAQGLREAALKTPLDRLLLETDSPYLPPQEQRGSINTPANVRITADFIAKLKGISVEELAGATSANAQDLFEFVDNETDPKLDN